MRGKIIFAGLILSLSGLAAQAQTRSNPFPNDVTCSGVVSTENVPRQSFIITGEESDKRSVWLWSQGARHSNPPMSLLPAARQSSIYETQTRCARLTGGSNAQFGKRQARSISSALRCSRW